MIWRVVLDSNIYLSGILFKGIPARLLTLANRGGFHVCISRHILVEIEAKLLGKFQRDPVTVRWQIRQILTFAEVITAAETINVCRDPDDNRIIECAVASQADFIVTGDKDLLTLNPYQNVLILTAREFLERHITTYPSI